MGALGTGPALYLRAGARGAGTPAPTPTPTPTPTPAPTARYDFTGGTMPAGATLTRASAATRVDANRALVTEAADAARFAHDLATGALLGLLVEPAATNRLAPSADPGLAPWYVATGSTAIGAGVADPAGGNAARRITMTRAAAGDETMLKANLNVPGSVAQIFLRAGDANSVGRGVYLGMEPQSGTNGFALHTLTAEWRRAISNPVAGNTFGVHLGYPSPGYFGVPAQPAGVTVFDAWGGQVEAGGASSYVANADGTARTRAEDVLMLAGPGGDWRITYADGAQEVVALSATGGAVRLPGRPKPIRVAEWVG